MTSPARILAVLRVSVAPLRRMRPSAIQVLAWPPLSARPVSLSRSHRAMCSWPLREKVCMAFVSNVWVGGR